jgi:hypothetical protein
MLFLVNIEALITNIWSLLQSGASLCPKMPVQVAQGHMPLEIMVLHNNNLNTLCKRNSPLFFTVVLFVCHLLLIGYIMLKKIVP